MSWFADFEFWGRDAIYHALGPDRSDLMFVACACVFGRTAGGGALRLQALRALIASPECDLELAQRTLGRYRGYGKVIKTLPLLDLPRPFCQRLTPLPVVLLQETEELWGKASVRLAEVLLPRGVLCAASSAARVEVMVHVWPANVAAAGPPHRIQKVVYAATWTVLHHDGPNHLGLWLNGQELGKARAVILATLAVDDLHAVGKVVGKYAGVRGSESAAAVAAVRHPELKLNIPAWVSCMSWCADFEFRGMSRTLSRSGPTTARWPRPSSPRCTSSYGRMTWSRCSARSLQSPCVSTAFAWLRRCLCLACCCQPCCDALHIDRRAQ